MILCLETATEACSVALNHDGGIIATEGEPYGQKHSEKITVFIDSIMRRSHITYEKLEAVAVSMGPGSYTGLRIGVSTAKGICYAASKPLIAIDTLESMAYGLKFRELINSDNAIIIPMIDARRMEVYAEVFDSQLNVIKKTEALIIDENSFSEYKKDHEVYLLGNGADKCAELFTNDPKIHVIKNFVCHAAYMAEPVQRKLEAKDFVDVAYFEPFYLKDFVPGTPTVKGLK